LHKCAAEDDCDSETGADLTKLCRHCTAINSL